MTDKEVNIIIVGSSVIIAFIGLFLVFKILMVWKQVNKNVLKARVFLDDNFLARNLTCVFLAGAFIATRRVIQLLGLLEFPIESKGVTYLVDLMGLAIIILLVLLAYYWFRLVYSTVPSSGKSVKASGSMD